MAEHTEIYRKRGSHIAIVRFNANGTHSPINNLGQDWPTKPTWTNQHDASGQLTPLIPGHLYAALQSFVDLRSNVNEYVVLRLVDITETHGVGEAKDLSMFLWELAKTSRHAAIDDKRFLLICRQLNLLSEEEYTAALQPVVPVPEPTKKSTLVF